MKRILAVMLAWASPGLAMAHNAHGSDFAWSFEPWALAPMALAIALFAIGWPRIYRRSQLGRAGLVRRASLFTAGMIVLAGAAISPLHELGEHAFSAHMLEHELIMLVAAPLLAASMPLPIFAWAFSSRGREQLGRMTRSGAVRGPWRWFNHPMTATLVQAMALWLWHLPWLFDKALTGEGWHVAQHISFLASALLFWSAMFRRDASRWLGALCQFAASMISGLLGALMALSQSPWYARYAEMGMTPLGLTPAQDQQLAGLLMWAPGGMVHAIAALVLIYPQLRDRGASRGTIVVADSPSGPRPTTRPN